MTLDQSRQNIICEPKIIQITRGRFDPAEFIEPGWGIVADETDARSTVLTELDLTQVKHVTMLSEGEVAIRGEEKLARLKEKGCIRLDAEIFLTLWENKHFIPQSWKEYVRDYPCLIFFDGTILGDPIGNRYVLFLCGYLGMWYWGVESLVVDRDATRPSAILESNTRALTT